MNNIVEPKQLILDAALCLAEQQSWEGVRLHEVAHRLGMTLEELSQHIRQKDDLVDAWFDRADRAALQAGASKDFLELGARGRLQRVIMSWLGALAPHRGVTRQMILGQLEPGHVHVQFAALMRISRTVQWLREAAHRDSTYLQRALDETVLTSIYVATFLRWLIDESPGSFHTARFLDTLLGITEKADRAPRK